MRRGFYHILLSILLSSCASDYKKKSEVMNEMDIYKMSEMSKTKLPIAIAQPSVEAYQSLVTIKLQELYELVFMQKQHPEFASDIALRLAKLKEDSLNIAGVSENVIIKNLEQKKTQILDSMQYLTFQFDVVGNSGVWKDSITAQITRNKVLIDGHGSYETKLFFVKAP